MALRTILGMLETTSLGPNVGDGNDESLAITLGIQLGVAEGHTD